MWQRKRGRSIAICNCSTHMTRGITNRHRRATAWKTTERYITRHYPSSFSAPEQISNRSRAEGSPTRVTDPREAFVPRHFPPTRRFHVLEPFSFCSPLRLSALFYFLFFIFFIFFLLLLCTVSRQFNGNTRGYQTSLYRFFFFSIFFLRPFCLGDGSVAIEIQAEKESDWRLSSSDWIRETKVNIPARRSRIDVATADSAFSFFRSTKEWIYDVTRRHATVPSRDICTYARRDTHADRPRVRAFGSLISRKLV